MLAIPHDTLTKPVMLIVSPASGSLSFANTARLVATLRSVVQLSLMAVGASLRSCMFIVAVT